MAARDLEIIVLEALERVRTNLNPAIEAINADKGDTLLSTVDDAAFFYQDFGQEVAAFDPAVYLTIGSTPQETRGNESSEIVKLVVELYFAEAGLAGSLVLLQKLLRYRKAIHATLKNDWKRFHVLKAENIQDIELARADDQGGRFFGVAVVFTFQIAI